MLKIIGPYKPYIGGAATHIENFSRILTESNIEHSIAVNREAPSSKREDTCIYIGKGYLNTILFIIKNRKHLINLHLSQDLILANLICIITFLLNTDIIFTFHSGKSYQLIENYFLGFFLRNLSRRIVLISNPENILSKNYLRQISPLILEENYLLKGENKIDSEYSFCSSGLYKDLYNHIELIDFVQTYAIETNQKCSLHLYISTAYENPLLRERILKAQISTNDLFKLIVVENSNNLTENFSNHNIYVRSTSWDSFGIAIVEALQAGCFIICSKINDRINVGAKYNLKNYQSFKEAIKQSQSSEILEKNSHFLKSLSNTQSVLNAYFD